MTTLTAYFENRIVGRIEIHGDGPSFVYDSSWLHTKGAFPISTTIPLSTATVQPAVFVPWAANLLPEGRALRRVGELIHAAPEDVMKILQEIGRDTAGALSIDQPGTTNPDSYREIETEEDLERIIDELPRKPFLAGEEGVSMSLAGFQSKLGVRQLDNGNLAIPLNGSASTHILKPDSPDLRGSVQNEAFCLTLARLCGISTSQLTTGKAGQRQYLLVNRYDRIYAQNRWRRLHQEDFCQALGKPPEAKYEKNQTGIQGPTALDMIAVARNTMKGPALLSLLDYLVFNIIVCNTDAHAKNYSMLITAKGSSIAPIYDVVCTQVWDRITNNLAQSVDGRNRGDHIKRRHWQRFAESAGFNAKSMINRINALLDIVERLIPEARQIVGKLPAGDHVVLTQVEIRIKNRIKNLRVGLKEDYAASEYVSVRGKNRMAPKSKDDYVRVLRKVSSPGEFSKVVRRLDNDRNMKAGDVKAITHAVLNRQYKSKKAALEALRQASASQNLLISE